MNSPSSMKRLILAILATRIFIAFTHAVPMSYATYNGNDLIPEERPQIVLLVNERKPQIQSLFFRRMTNDAFRHERDKKLGSLSKMGSLSITNSLDVLRNRVLLEMARRMAQQDEPQIAANRRLLESIGKRSIPDSLNRSLKFHSEENQEERSTTTSENKIPKRTQEWLDGNDPVFRHDEEAETERVQNSELPLL
ncbi:diuretic hormone 44 [Prorops nasuta]|uniref:diuretic hormone 44 n=1 Tax=Prorops nasuta TaxID=863751 RepID=UPI0034CF93C2